MINRIQPDPGIPGKRQARCGEKDSFLSGDLRFFGVLEDDGRLAGI